MSQFETDLGNAAIKVGGSVLSGMKSLGGMAYSAAKARAGFVTESTPVVASPSNNNNNPNRNHNRFFSRSAPESGGSGHNNRLFSKSSFDGGDLHDHGDEHAHGQHIDRDPAVASPASSTPTPSGYYVTVVDLASIPTSGNSVVIAEFLASRYQPISQLKFSADGISLFVVPKDGQVVPVFQIRPTSKALRALESPLLPRLAAAAAARSHQTPSAVDSPLHLYDLRRGHTSAVVERVALAYDGRWAAVGTRNRTVHVFAMNPYGGKPDPKSHLDVRVRNLDELVSFSKPLRLFR